MSANQSRIFETISPTAHITNYLRERYNDQGSIEEFFASLTGSAKVFHALGGTGKEEEFALFIAARYRVLSREIFQRKFFNIFELAGGLSPRGLGATIRNKSICYIETDMPAMAEWKHSLTAEAIRLFEAQRGEKVEKGNYIQIPLDSTDSEGFEEISRKFPAGPVGVITEGLLPYLYRDDLERVCVNIRNILASRGGVWVTDMITRASLRNPIFLEGASRALIPTFYTAAATNQGQLAFEDPRDVIDFFHARGFAFERVSAVGFSELRRRALERGLSEKRVNDILSARAFFILSLR